MLFKSVICSTKSATRKTDIIIPCTEFLSTNVIRQEKKTNVNKEKITKGWTLRLKTSTGTKGENVLTKSNIPMNDNTAINKYGKYFFLDFIF